MAETFDVKFGDKTYQGAALTGEEQTEFEIDFQQLMASTSDDDEKVENDVRMLLASRKAEALGLVQVLKAAKGASFIGHRKTGTGWKLHAFIAEDFGNSGHLKHEFSVAMSLGVNNWIGDPDSAGNPFVMDDYAGMILLGELIPRGAARVHNAVLVSRDTGGKAYPAWIIPRNAPRLFTYPSPLVFVNQENVHVTHCSFVSGSSSAYDLSIPIGLAVVRAEKELTNISAASYAGNSTLLGT